MTKTLPITEARQRFPALVNRISKGLDKYVITVNGRPAAMMISVGEYESWRETNEILADKKLMNDIQEAEKDIEEGRVYDWEDVKKELGLDVQNKINRKGQDAVKESFKTA